MMGGSTEGCRVLASMDDEARAGDPLGAYGRVIEILESSIDGAQDEQVVATFRKHLEETRGPYPQSPGGVPAAGGGG